MREKAPEKLLGSARLRRTAEQLALDSPYTHSRAQRPNLCIDARLDDLHKKQVPRVRDTGRGNATLRNAVLRSTEPERVEPPNIGYCCLYLGN